MDLPDAGKMLAEILKNASEPEVRKAALYAIAEHDSEAALRCSRKPP
ncbi:MAG: hypothetical protein H6628_00045 [Calditrichae bacterium]|nr:hypothetical protein [Calditrichia bacterium]